MLKNLTIQISRFTDGKMRFNSNLDYFLFSLIILGILFQATILFIPAGFNSDAAATSLLAHDIISQKRWIFFSSSAHTEKSLIFPISPITPLVLIFLIFGFVDWGVRLTIIIYNLLSAFFLYKLTGLWFNEKTARISLVLFLFSPWVVEQFNLWVPTAFLFTVMPIYVHQMALKDKRYLPMAYSLLGLSFYFFSTAKIVVSFYLLLYLFFNPRRFSEKSNIVSFVLFILVILPWLLFTFSSSQKEIIFRPEPASFSLEFFISLIYLLVFITPFLLVAFYHTFDILKRIVLEKKFDFVNVFLSGWLLSVFFAIYLATPYLRPRVIYYSAPAFIILSSWVYSRVSRENIYTALAAFALSGIIIHATLSLDKHAIMPMGYEYGLDRVTKYLLSRDDVGWIYTDLRMDKQILFYSQRRLPLMETRYPLMDSPTFPWLDYRSDVNISTGCYYYSFWANLERAYLKPDDSLLSEDHFLRIHNGSSPVYSVDYPWGDRAINVYRICND